MLQDTIKDNENIQVNSKEMEALKEHFPQCFDKNGNFDMAIFEELVKTKDISIKKEGYALNFLGKSYARYLSNLDSETVIVPDESNKDNLSENIYIVGDNLDALQHLKHSYAGAIKCIYIDPPYNTGSDGFVYNDKFEFNARDLAEKIGIEEDEAERILNMQGKSTHSAWLTFMYPRLELAKELLTEDGAIFISIGQDEGFNLVALCNGIFGENNKVGIISRMMKSGGNKGEYFSPNIEYVLVYAKNKVKLEYFREPLSEETRRSYNNIETDGERKGEYYSIKGLCQPGLGNRTNQRFYIEAPDGSFIIPKGVSYPKTIAEGAKVIPTDEDTCWKWTYERYKEEKAKGNIVFKKSTSATALTDETGQISKWNVFNKIWLKDRMEEGRVPVDLITKWENRISSQELKDLGLPFDFAKPVDLIKYLIELVQNTDNAIVMDFFSGSATTAHAVMASNACQGNKKFIMIQIPEKCAENSEEFKAGYKTIDEIGRERIRRAAAKLRADEPEKSKEVDLGFKTYYLKTPEKQTLDKMESFNPEFPIDGDDIIAAFGKDTVLATWGIKDGYGFNTPIKEIDLKGYTAYFINDGIHGANLYLLDEISEPSIMELVRKLESNELVADKIIVYGYALSYTASTSLRTNLKTLKNRNPIDVVIRY